jgi:hypothetical protein
MPWPFVFAHFLNAAGSAILLIRGFAPFLAGTAAIKMALDRVDLSFVRDRKDAVVSVGSSATRTLVIPPFFRLSNVACEVRPM